MKVVVLERRILPAVPPAVVDMDPQEREISLVPLQWFEERQEKARERRILELLEITDRQAAELERQEERWNNFKYCTMLIVLTAISLVMSWCMGGY